MPSTEELVNLARRGDTAAFTELVNRYQRSSILSAYAVLGDFHAAQDVAQEAFVIAYRKLDELRDSGSFGSWLLQIARRVALRERGRQRNDVHGSESMDLATNQDSDWIERYEEVVQYLGRLPEHERIIIVMRYVDGLSVHEIAESVGRPVGTVTKQISRAIQRLREWLKVAS